MAKNYTFNASLNCSATSSTGYSQSQSGAFQLDITGIDYVESGRKDIVSTSVGTTISSTFQTGILVYVRNLDETNFVTVSLVADADNTLGILEPGEFLFTIIRATDAIQALADTATVTIEYFVCEIGSNNA